MATEGKRERIGAGRTRSRVAVVKTRPETVLADVASMMRGLDYARVLDRGRLTILKDNISWHLPYLSSNSTPWQIEGVVKTLREDGYRDLLGLHNQTVVTDAHRGDQLNKFAGVYRRYEVKTADNFAPDCRWVRIEPKAKLLVLDRIFGEVKVPEVMIGTNVVHLPTVKTHVYTTMTGAMKNAFGGLLRENRHWAHTDIHATLVDLLAIQKEIHPGLFAVMDGTICGDGAGPRAMIPVVKDYMLASDDMVAIDAVSAWLMGFDPLADVDCIRMAHERGLGVGDVREIEVVGEDVSEVNFHFRVRYHLASRVGRLLWFTPLARIQSLFFKTPLVHAFIWGSAHYHDHYWWPVHGKKRMAEVAITPWGRLFEAYE
ncbi:MAG TPA: DUF362 domain-containing protein [Vicinamibacteria bacterium]